MVQVNPGKKSSFSALRGIQHQKCIAIFSWCITFLCFLGRWLVQTNHKNRTRLEMHFCASVSYLHRAAIRVLTAHSSHSHSHYYYAGSTSHFSKNYNLVRYLLLISRSSTTSSSSSSSHHIPSSGPPPSVIINLLPFGLRTFSSLAAASSNLTPWKFDHQETSSVDDCEDLKEEDVAVVDMLYKTVIDNSNPAYNITMETELDRIALKEVKLTTYSIMAVLHRLRFEEKLAFRFFTWAGRQDYYSHEPRIYNDMIDILSSTKYKVKQFRIVCDILDYMKRKNNNTNTNNKTTCTAVPIEVLLTILRKYTEKHLTHLQKFAKKKKVRVMTQPEINAFNLLLDALCKCSLVEDAETMFKKVKCKVKPDANTFNILFFGWCRVRNPKRGMMILDDMIKMGYTPDNFTYNTAIDTFCKAGMVTEAADLLEFMRTKGSIMSSPTAKTYATMFVALVQSDRIVESFKLLGDMISSGCLPDVSTYKELIEGMCLVGKIDAAYKFLEAMGNKGYPPDIVTYNCFFKVLCDSKDSDEALRLYGRMIEVGCLPSVHTFNMLITMFFEMGDSDGAFKVWEEMDKRGCPRDADTYCVMIEGLFGCNQVEEGCFLLEEVVTRGVKLPYRKFDTFLMQLSGIGNLRAIHRLSEHMWKFYNPAMARRFALNQKRKSVSLRGK